LKPFEIITVAKVGSASFKKSLEQLGPCPHSHNLLRLKNILKEGNRTIISGIRNPIDRNLSYFFQTYGDNFFNSLKTQKNGYKGENCFVKELVNETRPEEFIRQFFLQKNLYVFNDWFEEFLAMTEISSFDKESGLQLYELKNNNTLLFYKLESLNKNLPEIKRHFGLDEWLTTNVGGKKKYGEIYAQAKEIIEYPDDYLDKLLNTSIMKMFYTEDEISRRAT
jgi:hypothetical protein